MFDAMEEIDTRNWREKLNALIVGGREPVDKAQSVYSAIRDNFGNSDKEFSIRSDKKSKLKPKPLYVIRLK